MSYWDSFRQLSGTGGISPTPTGGTSGGSTGFAPRSLLERPDLNTLFGPQEESFTGQISNVAVGLGTLPSRIYETPFALADVAAQQAGLSSPIDWLAQKTPLGAVGGALGQGIYQASSIVPRFLNSEDARIWGAVGDLPDDTVITRELLESRGEASPSGFFGGAQTGGIPVLANILQFAGFGTGPGGRDKTVGELREELTKRGFFYDDKGELIAPAQLAQQIRSGQRGTFDFDRALINDDPLVSLAGQVALDPTNLLFLVPGLNGLKAADTLRRTATRIEYVNKLREVGLVGRAAQSADVVGTNLIRAAAAGTLRGTAATLPGLSWALRNYRRVAIASSVGTFAVNRAALLAGDLPFANEIEEFTNAVAERHPMSENAAFMLFAAATFPYGPIVRGVGARVRGGTSRRLGYGDVDAIAKEYGGTKKAEDAFGGPDSFRAAIDFADAHIASAEVEPSILGAARSLPEMADRRRIELLGLGERVNDMRGRGQINSEQRLAGLREWFENDQAGFTTKDEFGKPLQVRGRNPYDPALMAARWSEFYHGPRQMLKPLLDETGEITYGLRSAPVKEDLAAARTLLRSRAEKGTVSRAALLEMVNRNPAINSGDKTGYWARFFNSNEPSLRWSQVRSKLDAQIKTADSLEALYADLAPIERAAPEALTDLFTRHRRLQNTAGEVDQLRQAMAMDRGGLPRQAPKVFRGRENPDGSVVAPSDLLGAATPTEGYVYHLTPDTNLDTIRKTGLEPRQPGGGDPSGVYFGSEGSVLAGYVPWKNQRSTVLLRMRTDAVPLRFGKEFRDTGFTGEVIARERVPSDVLEYLGSDDAWHPLSGDTPPTLRTRHDALVEQMRDAQRALEDVELRKANIDPGLYAKILNAGQAMTGDAPLVHASIKVNDPAELVMLGLLERDLAERGTGYRIKALPKTQALVEIPDNLRVPIRYREALGESLFIHGPLSVVGRSLNALLRRVPNEELYGGLRQELTSRMTRLGFGVRDADRYLSLLNKKLEDVVWPSIGPLHVRWFRDVGALMPGHIARVMDDLIGELPAAKRAKLREAVATEGGAYRMLAKSQSRFQRSLAAKAKRGGREGAAATKALAGYNAFVDSKYTAGLSQSQRVLARTIYPLFRFTLDPRWLLLNYIEGAILGASRYGVFRRYRSPEEASNAARSLLGHTTANPAATYQFDTLQAHKGLNLNAMKAFDAESLRVLTDEIDGLVAKGRTAEAARKMRAAGVELNQQMTNVLNEHGRTDAQLQTIRRWMSEEAADIRARGGDAQMVAHLERQSSGDIAKAFQDLAYRVEQEGPSAALNKTIGEEAAKLMTATELELMTPLIQHLHDLNLQTWNDVRSLFYGNPSRRTIERLANSFWLYWPISYQLKASKWLAEIMLTGAFGHNTNALGAGKYALWVQQHNERMANDPSYAAAMQANPVLWFAVQMLFPLTPENISVSMSPILRAAGLEGQKVLNDALDAEFTLFTGTAFSDDPAAAWSRLASQGPIYTKDLIERLIRDLTYQPAGSPLYNANRPAPAGQGIQFVPPSPVAP
jgi:hypothetical protein